MWCVYGNKITMTEGDFGVGLEFTVRRVVVNSGDVFRLSIKSAPKAEAIIEKVFENISQNKFALTLTEAETAELPVGMYVYVLDWCKEGEFMYNTIRVANFQVEEKA